MIPKYPDLVEWFLIDSHFLNNGRITIMTLLHGTGNKQNLSCEMACFQGYTDQFVLLLCAQTDTETRKTHTHTHTHARARTRTHTNTHTHTHAQPQ